MLLTELEPQARESRVQFPAGTRIDRVSSATSPALGVDTASCRVHNDAVEQGQHLYATRFYVISRLRMTGSFPPQSHTSRRHMLKNKAVYLIYFHKTQML